MNVVSKQEQQTANLYFWGMAGLSLGLILLEFVYYLGAKFVISQAGFQSLLIILSLLTYKGFRTRWMLFVFQLIGCFVNFFFSGIHFGQRAFESVATPSGSAGEMRGDFAAFFLLFSGIFFLGAAIFLMASPSIIQYLKKVRREKPQEREIPTV